MVKRVRTICIRTSSQHQDCVKSLRIQSYSGPYFPTLVLRISPYSVRMRENTDQKNSEYGLFSRSAESQRFSYVFMGYRKRLLVWNGLIEINYFSTAIMKMLCFLWNLPKFKRLFQRLFPEMSLEK